MKRNTPIRLLALVLALAMLLCGCAASGKQDTASPDADGSQKTNGSAAASELASKYTYTAKYFNAPSAAQYVSASCMADGALYLAAAQDGELRTYTDEASGESYQYNETGYQVYKMDLATGESTPIGALITDPREADAEGWTISQSLFDLQPGKDGSLWLFWNVNRSRYDLPESFDPETDQRYNYYVDGGNVIRAVELAADGSIKQDLTLDPGETARPQTGDHVSFFPQRVLITSDGSFAASSDRYAYLWSADGTLTAALDNESYADLKRLNADTIGVVSYTGDSMKFQALDTASKSWGETITLPDRAWNPLPGNSQYDFFYNNGTALYGYKTDSGKEEKLVDWLACDVNSDSLNGVYVDDSGKVCAILRDSTGSYGYYIGGINVATATNAAPSSPSTSASGWQVAVLTPTDAAAVTEKQELTLACLYLPSTLRAQVLAFNRASDKYRIVVRDYSEYNTDEDYTAGLTKLNTEILSGNVPDMICTNQLPVAQYAAKGVLEELWQYIDADPELSRDQLLTQPLEAMQTGDGLYQITDSFAISTAVALGKVVDGYDKWTVDAAKDALTKLQPNATYFNVTYTKSDVLSQCVSRTAGDFVDWQTGKCSFDSPEFAALLEFANSFQDTFDYEHFDWSDYTDDSLRIANGEQLVAPAYISSFDDLRYYDGVLKGDTRYIGWPTGSGEGGTVFDPGTSLAMTTRCADKDAAWQFMRAMLTDTPSDIWTFPVNRALFEKAAKLIMTPEYQTDENGNYVLDENGNKIEISQGGMSMGGGEMVEFYAMTQAQYDQLLALIDSASGAASYDMNINNIITEEAGAYFAGEKSVQDTAAAINNRVGLYVAEQR